MPKEPQDYILIDSLEVYTKVGCTEQERAFAQRLVFDLEILLPSKRPRCRGELANTVCYDKVCKTIVKLCQQQEWVLLEDIAECALQSIFETQQLAQTIKLTIKKQIVPGTNWTGIQFQRSRG